MWLIIITIDTIGFGDLYPKTVMGRMVGILCSFWGVFIVSIFVVTLNNMLVFTANEEKAYNLLLRLYYKTQLKERATLVLGSAFRQRNETIQNNKEKELSRLENSQSEGKSKFEESKKYLQAMRIFRMHMITFQQTARMVRSFYDADTDVEIMQKLIEKLTDEVKDVKERHESIMAVIEKVEQYLDFKLGLHEIDQ